MTATNCYVSFSSSEGHIVSELVIERGTQTGPGGAPSLRITWAPARRGALGRRGTSSFKQLPPQQNVGNQTESRAEGLFQRTYVWMNNQPRAFGKHWLMPSIWHYVKRSYSFLLHEKTSVSCFLWILIVYTSSAQIRMKSGILKSWRWKIEYFITSLFF